MGAGAGGRAKKRISLSSRERSQRSHHLNCSPELWKVRSAQETQVKWKGRRMSWKSGLVPLASVGVEGRAEGGGQAMDGDPLSTYLNVEELTLNWALPGLFPSGGRWVR